MKKALIYLLALMSPILISSCGNDEKDKPEEPEKMKKEILLDVKGINYEVLITPGQFGDVASRIRSNSVDFTIKATGINTDTAYVTDLLIDYGRYQIDKTRYKGLPPKIEPFPLMKGDWGYFEYVRDTNPYEIKIHLNQNDSEDIRTFFITIGKRPTTRTIAIYQYPKRVNDRDDIFTSPRMD